MIFFKIARVAHVVNQECVCVCVRESVCVCVCVYVCVRVRVYRVTFSN